MYRWGLRLRGEDYLLFDPPHTPGSYRQLERKGFRFDLTHKPSPGGPKVVLYLGPERFNFSTVENPPGDLGRIVWIEHHFNPETAYKALQRVVCRDARGAFLPADQALALLASPAEQEVFKFIMVDSLQLQYEQGRVLVGLLHLGSVVKTLTVDARYAGV